MTFFTQICQEIDVLCQKRAAEYPTRTHNHQRLRAKLAEFCYWLQEQQTAAWQPNPKLLEMAKNLTPIFIGGYQKSGTTFIRDLLDGHPGLSVLPGDAKLLHTWTTILHFTSPMQKQFLRELWIRKLVNPTGLPPFWLFGRRPEPYLNFLNYLDYWLAHISDTKQSIIHAPPLAYFCTNPQSTLSTQYWVDKTPTQELELKTLKQIYPSSLFIHVIRNPLASLASRKVMAAKWGRPFRLLRQLRIYRSSLQQGLKQAAQSDYKIIRYEDVLAAPTQSMIELSQCLDISSHGALAQPSVNGLPSTANSAYEENRIQGKIQGRSLDKWRQILTSREIAHITTALYPDATAYGYDWRAEYPDLLTRTGLRSIQMTIQFSQHMKHLLFK